MGRSLPFTPPPPKKKTFLETTNKSFFSPVEMVFKWVATISTVLEKMTPHNLIPASLKP